MPILTNSHGVPFEKPEPPAPDADIEEKIAYLRARSTYNDAIANCANAAFTAGFSRVVRNAR
jgi:hypothetical protein